MELFLAVLLFLLGLILIIKGGDFFVDAACWLAKVSGIPSFVIGATIVSVATTLPEMLVSVFSTAQGKVALAYGNAVGSVTANLGLILGISLVCLPAVISRKEFAPKAILMGLAAAVVAGFSLRLKYGLLPAILSFVLFAVYIAVNLLDAKKSMAAAEEKPKLTRKDILVNILKFVGGAAGIVWGSDLLVDNATILARAVGVSEAVIGATLVAVGTSLPELVTTVTALIKKESSLSVGNIIGANVMDLTLILSICSFISGGNLQVVDQNAYLDGPVCLLFALITILPTILFKKLARWQGVLLLVLYAAYVTVLVTNVFGFAGC